MSEHLEPVDAIALRKPLRPWRFPNGVVCAVKDIDGPAERLRREAVAEQSEEKFQQLLRLICPDATEAEWDSMIAEDYTHLYEHAAQKGLAAAQYVEARQKNAGAGNAETKPVRGSRRSSRTTTSPTNARA